MEPNEAGVDFRAHARAATALRHEASAHKPRPFRHEAIVHAEGL